MVLIGFLCTQIQSKIFNLANQLQLPIVLISHEWQRAFVSASSPCAFIRERPTVKLRIATLILSLLLLYAAHASDRMTGAVGVTGQNDMTFYLGFERDWRKTWLDSNTGSLGGRWDASYTYWERGRRASGAHSVSFNPVFVYTFKGWRYAPYLEAGIGGALFSKTTVGNRKLGSAFNFEDRFGVGLQLPAGQRIGVRAVHYSNGGLKQPNDGIESYSLYYSRSLP